MPVRLPRSPERTILGLLVFAAAGTILLTVAPRPEEPLLLVRPRPAKRSDPEILAELEGLKARRNQARLDAYGQALQSESISVGNVATVWLHQLAPTGSYARRPLFRFRLNSGAIAQVEIRRESEPGSGHFWWWVMEGETVLVRGESHHWGCG